MKYPLQDLLRVRLFREENAQAEVTKKRAELEQAEEAVKEREQELAEYIKYRETREEELYDDIMKKPVQLRNLDDLKVDIQILREKQGLYEQKVDEAKQERVTAEEKLEETRRAYLLSVKERQKIDEHKEIWTQEMDKVREADAEKELEDFRVRSLDGED